ncbi:MAG: PH domain-containing protein [Clostridia bacterium]|nr:PH domain-containing protein [Clostridia bacterium]
MIGLSNSSFYESNEALDNKYLSNLSPYFLKNEKIFKSFKNFDCFAHFTNKRIIFTYCNGGRFNPSHFEIEFLPYRSIQRFSALFDDKLSHYSIFDIPVLNFILPDKATAATLSEAVSEFSA